MSGNPAPDPYPRISLNGVYDRKAPIAADLALCSAAGISWLAVPNWKFAQDGVRTAIECLYGDPIRVSWVCRPNLLSLDDHELASELACAKRTIDIAVEVNAASVYLTTERRGQLNWEDAAGAFVDGVADLVSYAAERSMPLLMEPTAAFLADLSNLHTLGDVVDMTEGPAWVSA